MNSKLLSMVVSLWPLSASADQIAGDFAKAAVDISAVVAAGTPVPAEAPGSACVGEVVPQDADIQSAIDAAPAGATLCIGAGVFRVTSPLDPKTDQILIGAPNFGTALNGSQLISGFAASGGNFVATGFLPSTPDTSGACVINGCSYAQDVFVDSVQLTRVLSIDALKSGAFYEDFAANKIYVHDNPSGHLVEQSYSNSIIRSANSGINVKNFLIEKSANPAQRGMIDGQNNGQIGWVVSNNEVRFGHGVGIEVDSAIIRGNHIHHNGQLGVAGHGVGTLLDNNEIDHNNTRGYDPAWEAGGAKFATNVSGLVASNNNVHDNAGPGLWCDINCYNATYFRNVVTGNQNAGIFYEISGKALIKSNTVKNNGPGAGNVAYGLHLFTKDALLEGLRLIRDAGAGFRSGGDIIISASPNVEVAENTVSGVNGIGILQQNRRDTCAFNGAPNYPDGTPVCPGGAHQTLNAYIHDNNVTETDRGSVAGLTNDTGDNSYFTSKNNRFVNNRYHLPSSTGSYFIWANAMINSVAWRAAGQDKTGRFLSP
jgi:Right handed beta helix region